MKKEYKIVLVAGVFYLIYVLLFLARFNFNPSAAIELSEDYIDLYQGPLPSGLVVQLNSDGYDGQYYYLTAIDVLHDRTLTTSYRYKRIFYPLLAHIFSLGNPALVPWFLLLINYVSILWGTYILLLLLKKYKAELNLAYLFAFNVGFLICMVRDLCEPLLLLFILLSLYCWEKERYKASSLLLALAVLTKEAALAVIFPLFLYFLIKRNFRNMVIYSLPVAVYLIWQFIIFIKLGKFPLTQTVGWVSFPLAGIIDYLSWVRYPQSLQELYFYYSVVPVLLFSGLQLRVLFKSKPVNWSPYFILLFCQLFFILGLSLKFYSALIDSLGRQAIPLFLFSILSCAERKERYNSLLALLMFLMSLGYFFQKIIIFRVEYFVT
ncbi:MAG: AZOBR_p60025 family cell surface glycopolymer formation protein [bacterium]